MIKITVAQYRIEKLPGWQAYEDKILRLVELAKEQETQLLALSEYAGLEIAGWASSNFAEQFAYVQTVLDQYQQLFSSLAQQYQLHIQSGSIPVKENDGYYRNRAYLFSPDGQIAYQDKLYLTPFENQTKLLCPGTDLCVFDTDLGKLGINICYDCEFPSLAKSLVEAGVNLILVPSCTEKMSGLSRVSICSQARAIENQCYIAQSCLVGKWGDFIDIGTGQSSIYSPADSGFPEDGILAKAQLNTAMLLHADLDFKKLEHVRQHGEMRNFHDSHKQVNYNIKQTHGLKK